MNRTTKRLTALAVAAAVTFGVAWAVPTLQLRAKGQGTALAALEWDQPSAPVSNDTGTAMDPGGANPFSTPTPTRSTFHVGSTDTPTFSGGALTFTSTAVYDGYRFGVRAAHNDNRTGWVIQRAVLVDNSAAVPGTVPLIPGDTLSIGLDPSACGKSLSADKNIGLGFRWGPTPPDGSTYAFLVQVEVVPSAAYVPALCTSWTGLVGA